MCRFSTSRMYKVYKPHVQSVQATCTKCTSHMYKNEMIDIVYRFILSNKVHEYRAFVALGC